LQPGFQGRERLDPKYWIILFVNTKKEIMTPVLKVSIEALGLSLKDRKLVFDDEETFG
jgi:hypothetical protein